MEKRKYNVVFSISYNNLEADDEIDAAEIARTAFTDELQNLHCGMTEIFGCNVEELE